MTNGTTATSAAPVRDQRWSGWQLTAIGTGLAIATGFGVALLVADVFAAQLVVTAGLLAGGVTYVVLVLRRVRQERRAEGIDWGTLAEQAEVSAALSAAARGRTTPLSTVQHRRAVAAARRGERLQGGDTSAWCSVTALSFLLNGALQLQHDSTASRTSSVMMILGAGLMLGGNIVLTVARRRTRAVLASPESLSPESAGPESR